MNVFVIIVTYNGTKWIEACLKSVLSSSIPIEIIVIDNNSSDNIATIVKSNFPQVTFLQQKVNLGFGKANNIGMSLALKKSADYVFLLNQDAIVMPVTIKTLINVAQKNKQFGILSPIQLDYSGEYLEEYFLKFMAKGKGKLFYSDFVLEKDRREIYEVDFIQAASWLLPMATLKNIGGFDPVFFHYGEDNNYCQRVLFHGLKIGVVPNTFVRHDATKEKKEDVAMFSETYFKNFKKDFCLIHANLNTSYNGSIISKQRRSLFLAALLSLVKLNFKKANGFYKKVLILNDLKKQVSNSRENNATVNSHYLDV